MNLSNSNFSKKYHKLYNIIFEHGYLKDSHQDIMEKTEYQMLSSGEKVLCKFVFFIWNNSFGFNIQEINDLDKEGMVFIISTLNNLYSYEN